MRRGKQRTMTNLSSVPSFRVQNPQSSQSRANQMVGHWEAEGRAGEGSGVGLSGDLALNASQWESRQIPEQVMELRGPPIQDGTARSAGGLLPEHRPPGGGPAQSSPGRLPSPLLCHLPSWPLPGPKGLLVPGAQESAAASPEGAARGRRLAAGQFFEASLISKTMRGWEEGRQRSRMASGPVKTRLGS